MISEEQQNQATLYALGLLDDQEATQFEASLQTDAELREFVSEMEETASSLAHAAPTARPSAALKNRLLSEIGGAKAPLQAVSAQRSFGAPSWFPWAIAALFLFFCGYLLSERIQLRRNLASLRERDPLAQLDFYALAATPDGPSLAQAVVAWEPSQQRGILRVSKLPPPASGKDYQLWAVAANHPDPISAGLVHVDPSGAAEVRFKPVLDSTQVKLFAISLEKEGGSPTKEGPILLAGK